MADELWIISHRQENFLAGSVTGGIVTNSLDWTSGKIWFHTIELKGNTVASARPSSFETTGHARCWYQCSLFLGRLEMVSCHAIIFWHLCRFLFDSPWAVRLNCFSKDLSTPSLPSSDGMLMKIPSINYHSSRKYVLLLEKIAEEWRDKLHRGHWFLLPE